MHVIRRIKNNLMHEIQCIKNNLMHEIRRIKNNLMHEIHRIDYKNIDCEQFENLFMRTLNYHAPQKRRLVRANNSPFMAKELYKAIMTNYDQIKVEK